MLRELFIAAGLGCTSALSTQRGCCRDDGLDGDGEMNCLCGKLAWSFISYACDVSGDVVADTYLLTPGPTMGPDDGADTYNWS